jgi:hypothetical protein
MFPTDVKNTDHPDFVGGIVWSTLELKWIKERDEQWKALLAFYADPSTTHSPHRTYKLLASPIPL